MPCRATLRGGGGATRGPERWQDIVSSIESSPCAPRGVEWIVDAQGCDASRLKQRSVLEPLLHAVVADLGLSIVGAPHWHAFPGHAGVTALYLLAESHLSCHTYPEHGLAAFNLYCCRQRPDWPWEARLADVLGARRVDVRRFERGATG